MKKYIVVLLSLIMCFSLFADDNTTWTYDEEQEYGMLYHLSADFIVSEGDTIYYAADFNWDARVGFAFIKDYGILIITFEGILPSEEVSNVVYAETIDGLPNGDIFKPTYSEAGSCILSESDTKFFFNELAYYSETGCGCFALAMKSGKLLFFTLNCENLYKYATYLE